MREMKLKVKVMNQHPLFAFLGGLHYNCIKNSYGQDTYVGTETSWYKTAHMCPMKCHFYSEKGSQLQLLSLAQADSQTAPGTDRGTVC